MKKATSVTVTTKEEVLKRYGASSLEDLTDHLIKVKAQTNKNYLIMAEILYHIKTGDLFYQMGYRTWVDFCTKAIDMDYHKANYFVDLWRHIKDLPKKAIRQIGEVDWTKTREIARVVTEQNYPDWIDKAKRQTHEELVKEVRRYKEREIPLRAPQENGQPDDISNGSTPEAGNPDADKLYPMKFSLYKDQYDTVKAAIDAAARISHSSKPSYNLSLIAMEFISLHGDSKDLSDVLRQLEIELDLTIAAVDKEGKIVYGEEHVGEAD